MSEPIFIARQDTLDEKIIPAQLLNDYKLHGEYSFVFHTPELWHKMCTHAYAANDQKVNGDALEYVLTKAAPTGSYSLSNWMALLCDTAEQAAQGLYAGIETAGQLAQSSAAMAAVSNSETAMAAVSGSEMAMNSICSVKTALRAFAASKHWNSTVKENGTARICGKQALEQHREGKRHGDRQSGGSFSEQHRIFHHFQLCGNGGKFDSNVCTGSQRDSNVRTGR